MPDRDEVVKGLEKVWDAFDHMEHELYADYVFDALVLLKGQEAVKPVKRIEENEWTVCGYCHEHLISKWMFCPNCGKAVRWDG